MDIQQIAKTNNLRYTYVNREQDRKESFFLIGERYTDIFVKSANQQELVGLVTAWLTVRTFKDISLAQFAGARGFDLRCYGSGVSKQSTEQSVD